MLGAVAGVDPGVDRSQDVVGHAPAVDEGRVQSERSRQFRRLRAAAVYQHDPDTHLVQDADLQLLNETRVVTERAPTEDEMRTLLFSWRVAKFVKSNAIVYCRDGMTIGVGAGQMSRVYSAKIAGIKAADENLEVKGSVMASDAFFPFRDGIDNAAAAGIAAVIQPGGSMRSTPFLKLGKKVSRSMPWVWLAKS